MADTIKHLGTVEHMEGSHIQVRIVQQSSCSSCEAKGYCNSSESKEKLIDVYNTDTVGLRIGDKVEIYGTTTMGMKAVWLAFGVPFLILLVALFVSYTCTGKNEALSGIVSLITLLPYYIVLYFCRGKLKKKFSFTLKQINN